MKWILWALLLLAQNASFTLVSRARNSKSLRYHAAMSTLSNGVWFASQYILLGSMLEIMRVGSWLQAIGVGTFYVGCTMAGSLGAHWLALRKIEKEEE